MKLTPRKDEIKAVVDVLESDGYDNADQMARAVIKVVAEALGQREWYAYAHRFKVGQTPMLWGPLSSDKEVEKLARTIGLDGDHRSMKMYSPAAIVERMSKDSEGASQFCASCGHPKGAHQHPKQSGMCAVRSCSCNTPT